MYVFVLLCLAGFLNSCEREVLKGDEKIVQVEPATWQEQIKYAQIETESAQKLIIPIDLVF